MSRLVVNPGTPHAFEIQLRPGTNSIGRGDETDFKIDDPSVSGSHCQIVVNDLSVVLTDSGSTNGTFLDGSRIQESELEDGKEFRLGEVGVIFYSEITTPAPAIESAPSQPSLRISRNTPPPSTEVVAAPAGAMATADIDPALLTGTRFCKHHPKLPARFLCPKCNRAYCGDSCIMPGMGNAPVRKCRACGTEVLTFQFWQPASRGFYEKLPSAFLYPFKGDGAIILFFATIGFSAMSFISHGLLGIFASIALYGLIFLFMQNIIVTTTSDENESLSFPDVSGLLGAAFQLAGTIAASFWLAIGLAIARFSDVDIPAVAIIASVILGGIYFPMAFLVVAMKDTVLAANPLIVIPAIIKVPIKYSVTVALLLAVFGVRQLGSLISSGAGSLTFKTHDMTTFLAAIAFQIVWAFLSLYLLIVTMRILGLFYNGSKQMLGWFNH